MRVDGQDQSCARVLAGVVVALRRVPVVDEQPVLIGIVFDTVGQGVGAGPAAEAEGGSRLTTIPEVVNVVHSKARRMRANRDVATMDSLR